MPSTIMSLLFSSSYSSSFLPSISSSFSDRTASMQLVTHAGPHGPRAMQGSVGQGSHTGCLVWKTTPPSLLNLSSFSSFIFNNFVNSYSILFSTSNHITIIIVIITLPSPPHHYHHHHSSPPALSSLYHHHTIIITTLPSNVASPYHCANQLHPSNLLLHSSFLRLIHP